MSQDLPLYDILRTATFAAGKHSNQRRKDANQSPYINHPLQVCETLTGVGVTDIKVLQAALLHDTIEDTKTTEEELKQAFGEEVTSIVMEVTDDKSKSKVDRKKLQIIHAASNTSKEAKLVKLADKYCNIFDLMTNPPSRWSSNQIKGYMIWSYAVCKELAGINHKLDVMISSCFEKYLCLPITPEYIEQELEAYYLLIEHME
ncbi:MAG: hypothetical protein Sylvanvirus1_68 [Sylvanvirus sp.]|uniref:HD domain-containing protein n=1 Tax=Sylvanvirus sp. TaxID=2487774 RepID=A0A3G5AGZ7_9VIRU|nr:MAG: hypothetical protein Sylvanvirus1_68 [Sylvanvirus sp.]